MMLRFILWMIVVFVITKIFGVVLRSLRLMLTPNRTVRQVHTPSPFQQSRVVEDITYEEVKEPAKNG